MKYAQKDYSDKLGESDYSIAEAGSFITAIANLLSKFDVDMSPETINHVLSISGIDASKGLNWGAISFLAPTIAVEQVSTGIPASEFTIVELKSKNPLNDEVITSWAAVDNVAQGTIVDSYDGTVKSWEVYGGPVSFASFTIYPLNLVTPLLIEQPKATDSDLANDKDSEPEVEKLEVVRYLDGFNSSTDAATNANSAGVVNPGEYFVFNRINDMVNITKTPGEIGLWINPAKNTQLSLEEEEELNSDAGIYAEDEPVTIPVKKKTWQSTYVAFLGLVECVSVQDVTVEDVEGVQPPVQLEKDTLVPIAGKFTRKGVTYLRTKKSVDDDTWYGVPATAVKRMKDIMNEEDKFDEILERITKEDASEEESRRDKVIKASATAEGKFKKIFSRSKN